MEQTSRTSDVDDGVAARGTGSTAERRSTSSPSADGAGGRLNSLDGLRGVAAVVVLMHHLLLVLPSFGAAYLVADGWTGFRSPTSPSWWLYRTPLRLLWAGPEAVVVFFVLSGFVLTLLARSASTRGPWVVAYYVRRFIRLYLPVWGAVVLGVVLAVVVPRATDGLSDWIQLHEGVGGRAVLWDATLVDNTSTLNTPLWSLRIEVWFSILLPLAWWCLRRVPVQRFWPVWCVVLLCISRLPAFPAVRDTVAFPDFTLPALSYLPMFGVGMVLASSGEALSVLGTRIRDASRWGWPALCVVACVLIPCATFGTGWWLGPWGSLVSGVLSGSGVTVVFIGALEWRVFVTALERRPIRWLGVRSYSLYLVHEPIVVASAIGLHAAGWSWLGPALGAAALCLAVAAAFHRLVERPAIELSRRAGRALASRQMRARPTV